MKKPQLFYLLQQMWWWWGGEGGGQFISVLEKTRSTSFFNFPTLQDWSFITSGSLRKRLGSGLKHKTKLVSKNVLGIKYNATK